MEGRPEAEAPSIAEAESVLPAVPSPATDSALPVFVVINSEPEGADLFVDGAYRGTTPTLVEFDSVGVFQIRLELAGYDDVRMRFDPRDWGIEEGQFEDVVSITIPIAGTG